MISSSISRSTTAVDGSEGEGLPSPEASQLTERLVACAIFTKLEREGSEFPDRQLRSTDVDIPILSAKFLAPPARAIARFIRSEKSLNSLSIGVLSGMPKGCGGEGPQLFQFLIQRLIPHVLVNYFQLRQVFA